MNTMNMNNKTTLFLGDLSTFCSERDIHMAFAPYGEILEIKIMKSEDSYRNLSYGFIKFADSLSAQKAMNGLNGVLFCGRNLRVGWASYKNKKEPRTYHHDRIHSSSVHVSYLSYQLKKLINEESLRILFSTYGVVLDVSIKKSYLDESINRQCGYGFVHFSANSEGLKNALAAVAALNDATIDGVCYKCSISHNLEKQLIEEHHGNQQGSNADGMSVPSRRLQNQPHVHRHLHQETVQGPVADRWSLPPKPVPSHPKFSHNNQRVLEDLYHPADRFDSPFSHVGRDSRQSPHEMLGMPESRQGWEGPQPEHRRVSSSNLSNPFSSSDHSILYQGMDNNYDNGSFDSLSQTSEFDLPQSAEKLVFPHQQPIPFNPFSASQSGQTSSFSSIQSADQSMDQNVGGSKLLGGLWTSNKPRNNLCDSIGMPCFGQSYSQPFGAFDQFSSLN
eukprot:gene6770-7480_t